MLAAIPYRPHQLADGKSGTRTHVVLDHPKNGTRNVIAAGGAGTQIWVYGLAFTVSAAGTVTWQDTDAGALTGTMAFAANGGLCWPDNGDMNCPIWKAPTNKGLDVVLSADADMDGWLVYAVVTV